MGTLPDRRKRSRRQPLGPPPRDPNLANQELLWSSLSPKAGGATSEIRSGSRVAPQTSGVRPSAAVLSPYLDSARKELRDRCGPGHLGAKLEPRGRARSDQRGASGGRVNEDPGTGGKRIASDQSPHSSSGSPRPIATRADRRQKGRSQYETPHRGASDYGAGKGVGPKSARGPPAR